MISANGGLPAHRYTPQVTQRWPRGSEPASPGGGSRARFPATPGWVSLSAVVCGVWCVVCGVWCAAVACVVGLWLVCGVVGPSPLLAVIPVCYSPPLLAGFCCRWWCAAPRHSWLGPAGCGGVFRGRGCPLLCVFVVCVGVRGGRAVLCVACLWCLCFRWCGVVVRWVCLPGALLPSPWHQLRQSAGFSKRADLHIIRTPLLRLALRTLGIAHPHIRLGR